MGDPRVMNQEMRLDGKVAFITGGGTGIGRAIAELFASVGAGIVVVGRREQPLTSVVEAIRQWGGSAMAVPADVTNLPAMEDAAKAAITVFGHIDIVVANAGGSPPAMPLLEHSPETWRETIDVNLTGVWNTLKATVPRVAGSGGGAVLTIGSGSGRANIGGVGPYSVAKAGLTALTRVLALELRTFAIAVNEIIPGLVRTEGAIARHLPISGVPRWQDGGTRESLNGPQTRLVEWERDPTEVARLALFIATLPIRGTTGQQFSLAGRLL